MKAFIFDFDGVIVDSQKYWDDYTMKMFSEMVPGWTEEDNRRPRGLSVPGTLQMLRKEYGYNGNEEQFLQYMDSFALDLYRTKAQLIEGIEHLLERLRAMKVPIGIATASRELWLHTALDLHGIKHHFTAFTAEDHVEQSKPHPEVYLRTAKALKVDPLDCIAFEDSFQGLTSAKAAGMYAIALKTPDHLERAEDVSLADMVVAHPDELTEEILRKL